ncbi:MAG: amidohydrolase family protein, partial [Isosphaeraceae bacterium]
MNRIFGMIVVLAATASSAPGQSEIRTDLQARLRARVFAIRAIDTHDHLPPFDRLFGRIETGRGKRLTLFGILSNGYLPQLTSIPAREPEQPFDAWWARAKSSFDDVRATGFYRYNQIALRDLYGVDLNDLTDEQARDLDQRIIENDRDDAWVNRVITERANIALMVNDPYWGRFDFAPYYPFEAQVLNVTTLLDGFHPSEYAGKPSDDPYGFARRKGLPVETLDDYLRVLDALFAEAKSHGAVGLKTTRAYQRTLAFANVPQPRAERAFGRRRSELSPEEVKDFEDFIMWQLTKRSARFGLPFQIHTGHGRLQGSNPLLLMDVIEANPDTKFVLFHGGFPW